MVLALDLLSAPGPWGYRARPSQWLMEDPGGGDPVDAAADLAVELVREQLFQRISAVRPLTAAGICMHSICQQQLLQPVYRTSLH